MSADNAWDLIGENHRTVSDFTSVLPRSHLEGELGVGAKRVCDTGKKENVVEALTRFDRQARILTYVATEGLPSYR